MIRTVLIGIGLLCCITLLDAQELKFRLGETLVRVDHDVDPNALANSYAAKFNDPDLKVLGLISPQLNIWLFGFNHNKVHAGHLVQALNEDIKVLVAQNNHLFSPRSLTPGDPMFTSQWQWDNTGQGGGIIGADISALEAWDNVTGGVTANGDTIVVAVVDDGIDLDHEDFQGNLWVNRFEIPDNESDDDNNGFVDDYYGWNANSENDDVGSGSHGVSVSGMIGARGDNGIGITGINWDVKIMTFRYAGANEASAIQAYSYALWHRQRYNETNGAEGAFVVATNSSWGNDFGQPSEAPLWCAFYDTLGAHGILSAAATMNRDENVDVVGDLPTACASEFLISVTSSTRSDQRASAAYGKETIDVAAPGANVFTARPNDNYNEQNGTSFASPTVAGLIGLLYSVPCNVLPDLAMINPSEAARIVRDAIFNGVDKLPQFEDELKFGGRVNAHQSVLLLLDNCGECPRAVGLSQLDATDTEATLFWVGNDSVTSFDLQWRPVGTEDWTLVEDAKPPLTLDGLKACVEYEFQVNNICGDTTSMFSVSGFFTTDGCCSIPENLQVLNTSVNSASIHWNELLAARNYHLEVREEPDGMWMEITTNDAQVFLDELQACTTYGLRVNTDCDTAMSDFTDILKFKTLGCGACTDSTYCISEGNDASGEWIQSVRFEMMENVSGPNGGYASFEESGFVFEPGEKYEVSLTPGFSQGQFEQLWRIWVDLDLNGEYTEEELIFDPDNSSNTVVTDTLFFPAEAQEGTTRMRIAMKFRGFSANKPQSCGGFQFGEVEDYCIDVRSSIVIDNCPKAAMTDTVGTFTSGAIISWENIENALGFNYRYKPSESSDWEVMVTLDTFAVLDGLDFCTDYDFQLLTVCPQDTSSFSDTLRFKTRCSTGTSDLPPALFSEVKVYPNPFNHQVQLSVEAIESLNGKIYLSDVYGNIVMERKLTLSGGENFQLEIRDLGGLPSGAYFLVMTDGKQVYTQKLVKLN